MSTNLIKHRLTYVVIIILIAVGAAATPFISASCSTQQTRGNENASVERLRAMTRGGLLPADNVLATLEAENQGARTGALARMARARVRIATGDFAGAAALLDQDAIRQHTTLADYALLMRAQALQQAGRRVEARAAYEQLARDFPASLRAREATLRAVEIVQADGQAAAVPLLLKRLSDADDATALLLTAKAYEQGGDTTRALASYRRLYFFAPAAAESAEAAAAIARLNSTTSPATAEEAIVRAGGLFAAKRFGEAADAYTDAFARFSNATLTAPNQLRRGIAAFNARRTSDAIAALSAVPTSAGETRAEALFYLTQTHAKERQWSIARSTTDELRRAFPQSEWLMRALVAAGQAAKDARNASESSYFFRAAVNSYKGAAEVAPAQFELAWLAHEEKNYQESSRLLIEHLAFYADKNNDYRGRAGYWAARDAERAGRLGEARALYQAMQARYDANWYGYLAKGRLDAVHRAGGAASPANFPPDSPVSRAVANLQTVTVAEETAGAAENERLEKADQLNVIGLDEWAFSELDRALEAAPASPRLNLAKARIYRARGDNLQAFNVLRKSYPDYAQMKPEELVREEWDVFYPLAHWDIIVREARAKNLDPYTVAGLIRQESVFNPRAASTARAYGLMQLLVPTGRLVARRYGVTRDITVEALFEPLLNIQLGTGYMRDQFDKFGRIEYVAAAYNAGPGRAAQWRTSLPFEIDEWAEAVPFRETRGYVQGVVRNMLQYKRLYDEQGRFRSEVGARRADAVAAPPPGADPSSAPPADAQSGVRRRRVTTGQDENEE